MIINQTIDNHDDLFKVVNKKSDLIVSDPRVATYTDQPRSEVK